MSPSIAASDDRREAEDEDEDERADTRALISPEANPAAR
jgi:hypothetical protein